MKTMEKWMKRCEDCSNLKICKGQWTCEECFGQLCKDIDDCPEGITFEEIEKIEAEAKTNKVKLKARAEVQKERKPREKKHDLDKEGLIKQVAEFLESIELENVKITNESKLIEFDFNENHYKLDLIKQRKPKKQAFFV